MLTFNVVFTTGTVRRLLPLTLSLLGDEGVRLRLVGNGSNDEDRDLLERAAEGEQRLETLVLGGERPLEHGVALNELFDRFEEERFAIVDSDVLADGPFLADIWPPGAAGAAAFSATPVWATDDEATVQPGSIYLAGRQRVLVDGTPVGNSYLAIYDRAALEPVRRWAPRGFAAHDRWMLDRDTQRALRARGWRFRVFDTTRLLNLGLMLSDHRIESRDSAHLHHIGGVSAATFEWPGEDARWLAARAGEILRSDQPRRLQRVADGLVLRAYQARNRRRGWHRRMNDRRRLITGYLAQAMTALEQGREPPQPPPTDQPDIDRRVRRLLAALEACYPRAAATAGGAGGGRDG